MRNADFGMRKAPSPFPLPLGERVRVRGGFVETGFTLIEVIVSLLLIVIVGAIVVMGMVSVVKGYVITRINSGTAHKGQVAMVRIVKELNFINSVTAGTTTSITFNAYKNGTVGSHSISWAGTANDPLLLDGDILTDRVSNFALAYRDTYNSAAQTSWASTRKVIEFTLTIQGADNVNSSFTGRIVPRNL